MGFVVGGGDRALASRLALLISMGFESRSAGELLSAGGVGREFDEGKSISVGRLGEVILLCSSFVSRCRFAYFSSWRIRVGDELRCGDSSLALSSVSSAQSRLSSEP